MSRFEIGSEVFRNLSSLPVLVVVECPKYARGIERVGRIRPELERWKRVVGYLRAGFRSRELTGAGGSGHGAQLRLKEPGHQRPGRPLVVICSRCSTDPRAIRAAKRGTHGVP